MEDGNSIPNRQSVRQSVISHAFSWWDQLENDDYQQKQKKQRRASASQKNTDTLLVLVGFRAVVDDDVDDDDDHPTMNDMCDGSKYISLLISNNI